MRNRIKPVTRKNRRLRGCRAVIFLAGMLLSARVFAVELVIDPHLHRGVSWNDPTTTERQDYPLQFTTNNGTPLWVLGESLSLNSPGFNVPATVRPSGAYQWTNSYRGLVMGPANTADSDLLLTVNSLNEYGGVYRTNGQAWPNLYMSQRITKPANGSTLGFEATNNFPWLTDISKLRFSIEANLTYASNRHDYATGYNTGLHAAQYLVWLTVQNLGKNPDGSNKPGYGDYLWFGMGLYDDRYPLPGMSAMLDKGTGKLIYNIGISNFTTAGLQVGQWQTLTGDLYPHITNALNVAWTWSQTHPGETNFLSGSTNYGDYKLGGLLQGWEVPGLSIVTMQTRNLSVQLYGTDYPETNVFADDFNRTDTGAQTTNSSPNQIGTNWTIARGTWAVNAYQLKQAGGTSGDQTIYVNSLQTLNAGLGTNFAMQATIKLNTASSSAYAGLVFNLQNASNYYAFRYNGAGNVQLIKSLNGSVAAVLNVSGFAPVVNRPYTLTVASVDPCDFAVGIYDPIDSTVVYTNASVVDIGNNFQDGYGGLYANANTSVMLYDNFNLAVEAEQWTPPVVLSQPVGGLKTVGGSLLLAPQFDGNPAPRFQWKLNGSDIPNATNQTLMLDNLQPAAAGSYVLYATNAVGWTNTIAAVVSIPTGGGMDGFNRTDTAAQTTTNSPNAIGSHWTIGNGTWAISSNQLIQAGGSTTDQTLYLNTLKTLNAGAGTGFTMQASLQLNTTAGSAFAGLLLNFQSATNYYAFRFAGNGTVQLIKNVNGIINAIGAANGTFAHVPNRPYVVTVASPNPNVFTLGIFDTVSGTTVYTNASVTATAAFTNGYGGLYANTASGVMRYDDFVLTVAPPPASRPTVLVQPAGGNIHLGGSLTLQAYIDGNPAPQLQWKHNGLNLPNATNQTLTLNNLQVSAAGSYVLYATNAAGWDSTSSAVINNVPVAKAITLTAPTGGGVWLQVIGGKDAPTDADNDPLAVTSVTPGVNGARVFTDGTNINYASAAAFTGTDSFQYTVGDGRNGFDTATVTVDVMVGGQWQNWLAPAGTVTNGVVVLTCLGVSGYLCVLDWATNLTAPIHWLPVSTNLAWTNWMLIFTNTSSAPINFFRTRYVYGSQVMHTLMTTASQVTNIADRAWDDIRVASTPQPKNAYYIAGWNLGGISQAECHWDVGEFTGWRPASYQLPTVHSQAAMNGDDVEKSAMQAEGFSWGGYLRHSEVPTNDPVTGLPEWQQPNFRYAYAFSPEVSPFAAASGPTAKLVFQFDAAVPLYDDYGRPEGQRAIGFGEAGIIFIDRKAGVSAQSLHFLLIYFDKRGFNIPGGVHERVVKVGSGEMVVSSLLASNTAYCSRLDQTAFTAASAYSQTNIWSEPAHFGVTISRSQFMQAIADINVYIAANPDLGARFYSTNLEDYRLASINVAIEAALDFDANGGGGTPTTGTYPFRMSYQGSRMSVSTIVD